MSIRRGIFATAKIATLYDTHLNAHPSTQPSHLTTWTGGPHLTTRHDWVPHLRDGFIVDKVGNFRGGENPNI
jgi:hypothetical protein